jgi:hypothetical protein
MNLDVETVAQPGSGLVFNNTYGAGVTQAYRIAIVTAENELQSHFTNSVTVQMHFDLQPLGAGFSAQNTYELVGASYADFAAALGAHATTAADMLAVAGLPGEDPSHGVGFWIPSAEARVLGLSTDERWVDDTVVLNADQPHGFGKDTVSTIEHEITEGVFGRVSSLGIAMTGWQPMDLFRFAADGARDYSGGADGRTAVFGVDGGHLSTLEFHNAVDASGALVGGDLGDWDTSADLFGPGGPGTVGALSPTDLQALDVLGWTPAAPAAQAMAPEVQDAEPMTHVMSTFWGGWVEL